MNHRRVFTVCLPLFAIQVAAGLATYAAQLRARILNVEVSLSDTGTGAGSTIVDVKKNGTSIMAAGGLSIAGAAAGKTARANPIGVDGEPSGVELAPDDEITVDVTAVPGTTAPAGGFVTLACVAKDV